MKTVFKLAAVASLVVSSYSFAATYSLGDLGPPGEATKTVDLTKTGEFSDTFTFSIKSAANSSGSALDNFFYSTKLKRDVGVDTYGVELFKQDGTLVTRLWNSPDEKSLPDVAEFSFNNLAAGSYFIKVTGQVLGLAAGGKKVSYTLDLETTKAKSTPTATAVPENDAYAMMLAGLGLVGFAARRKIAA